VKKTGLDCPQKKLMICVKKCDWAVDCPHEQLVISRKKGDWTVLSDCWDSLHGTLMICLKTDCLQETLVISVKKEDWTVLSACSGLFEGKFDNQRGDG